MRAYGGPDGRPSLLIIAAPLKRPYLWDLAPSVSAVRYCLHQGLRVYLLEWAPPSSGSGNAGLVEYADQAIGEAVATFSRETGGMRPRSSRVTHWVAHWQPFTGRWASRASKASCF